MATPEAIDTATEFNGMSPEVFNAGQDMLSIFERLDIKLQSELFPNLIRRMTYNLMDSECGAEATDEAIDATKSSLTSLEGHRQRIELAANPREHHDLDY